MEALNLIRFWRLNNGGHKENQAQPNCGKNSSSETPKCSIVSDHEFDEGDDSFFVLELPLNKFGQKRFESKEEQTRSLSPNDNFSRRKIIPIEANSKPQSPITLLKSAPKFRVFTLRKSKSMANTSITYTADKLDLMGVSTENPEHEKQGSNKHSRVKFKIEESPNLPIFTTENNSPRTKGKKTEEPLKAVVQKYLNKIKPLYVKVSEKDTKLSGDLTMSSPATVFSMGNLTTGVKGVCKQLGKSRSASATSSPPMNKRDDSLLLQHDGIQSAILHCKKSLNSSREPSRLSRCTSGSSQKLSNASTTDSSVWSRVTSNSS